MTIAEFRWALSPAIPSHWQETLSHDGFEIEITRNWIEARKDTEDNQDNQQRHAERIVEGIVRKIGLEERTRFTITLSLIGKFDPQTGRRDIIGLISGRASGKSSGHADMIATDANGTVIADTRKERIADLLKFADTSSRSANLQRMTDYLLEYHADDDKKLAPLYDLIEFAIKIFGRKASQSLGVSSNKLSSATRIINDKEIISGRHMGQYVGPQRKPTSAESKLCEEVAEQIVRDYTKLA
jgi:hypothetical protein